MKHKLTRFEAISIITVFLLICGLGILDNYTNGFSYTKVEAQSPQRFQFQAVGYWDHNGRTNSNTHYHKLDAICDTATGTLIYSSGYEGGIWGVPNGCQKDPR